MSKSKRSLLGRVSRAFNAFFDPLRREVLPLSNSGTPVLPNQTCSITGRPQCVGFWPDHLVVSDHGTEGGAADWVVNDIQIARKSQFAQSGDIPGDLFKSTAVNSFVNFDVAKHGIDVTIIATYVGTNEQGCSFYASISGMEYDPGIFDVVREAISRALSSASRNLSARPG